MKDILIIAGKAYELIETPFNEFTVADQTIFPGALISEKREPFSRTWETIRIGNKRYLPSLLSSIGAISDGYHTFDELYEHRITNYIALASCIATASKLAQIRNPVWRTRKHSDGSVWDGWFMLGIYSEKGSQITYHLPEIKWSDCIFADAIDQAPEFDGHTSQDVLDRIAAIRISPIINKIMDQNP